MRGLPSQPHVARDPAPAIIDAPPAAADAFCDLCGEPMTEDHDAFDATGLNICPQCIEDTLHASTFNARSEVGLVGSGGVRC